MYLLTVFGAIVVRNSLLKVSESFKALVREPCEQNQLKNAQTFAFLSGDELFMSTKAA